MSQKYPYTNTGDDFLSHQDMYADSYQRQSNTHQPTVRASSQEQPCPTTSSNRTVDSLFHLPGMALSFLHSCGLDSSDLVHLAELPEHLITVETLPKLLLQIKESKLSSTSLSSSGVGCTSEPHDDTSTHAREGSSHSKPVEYPIDQPAHPAYPLPPEQVQTWQDRWGNPRRTNTVTSSSSSSVPDYNVSNYNDSYYRTTESPEAAIGPFVDFGPRPLLSLKLEPPIFTPSRHEASDFNCKIPPAFPHECCLCDISVSSTKEWLFHVRSRAHAENQLELVRKYPKWDQTVESARRIDRVFRVPTRKEAIDFNGTISPVFPYMCVLCKVTVFSETEWTSHITGGLHAKSQLELMAMYPEWDGTVRTSRRNDGHTNDFKDGTSENSSDMKRSHAKDEPSSRVVSFAPLPTGDGVTAELTAIAKRFGSIRKSLFLPNRGFVEMSCLSEAKKLVERYSASQLKLKGKLIQVTFSCEYNSLRDTEVNEQTHSQSSHKHSRSSLSRHKLQRHSPSPKRRHSSEKTRSSPKRRSSLERTHSSPRRRRSSERTQSSTMRRRSSEKSHSSPKRRHSSERTRCSPKRRHSSERTHSSPKRRRSSERTHSSPKRRHSSERTRSSPQKRHSSERTRSSPKRTQSVERTDSSSSHHGNEQEDKDTATKSNKDTEEREIVNNSYIENTDSDDDLEGLEVLADDEELVHDSDDPESTKSDQENLPSEPMDITDVHIEEQVKTEEDSPNADISEASNSLNEGQKIEEPEDHKIEEDHDFPKSLENCVTLDELKEENSSDCQESNEPKALIPETEETFGKVLEVRNLPSAERYTDTDIMNILNRYGNVTHHVLFQSIKKGFVEMEVAADAERIAADSKNQDIVLRGNILKIKVSEKYCHLPEEGFNDDDDDDDDGDNQGKGELSKDSKNKQQSDELNGDAESSDESLKTDGPVGTDFVRPVIGYSCTLCNILYASEEEAKDEHCRSPSHREKVKEHKEKGGCKK